MNPDRIRHLIHKEIIQLWRNPLTLRLIIAVPLIQTIVFGYVATTEVRNLNLLVCDQDGSALSRDLVARLLSSRYFRLVGTVREPGDIDPWLDQGRAKVAIVLPRQLSALVTTGQSAVIQVLVDGSNSSEATIALAYLQKFFNSQSHRLALSLADRTGQASIPSPGIDLRPRIWFNPELKSVNYMIPGMMCLILFMITSLLTALSIVRERETGTMEQLVVTPIKPVELIIGKTLPFALVAMIEAVLVLSFGTLWFGVALKGSLLWLGLASALFVITVLGLGMFVSTLAHTQAQAMLVNQLFMATNMLLSGFMFPIPSMPPAMQYFTYLVPLRYFLEIVRSLYLKGTGPECWWPQLAMLALFGLVLFGLSALRFRKRLD